MIKYISLLICCGIICYTFGLIHNKSMHKFGRFKIGDNVRWTGEYQKKESDKRIRKIYGFLITKENVFACFKDSKNIDDSINIDFLVFIKEEK